MSAPQDLQFMKFSECAKRLAITRQGLLKRASLGTFPRPIIVGVVGYVTIQEFDTITKAYMAGKSREEVKQIVRQIHQAREQDCVPAE